MKEAMVMKAVMKTTTQIKMKAAMVMKAVMKTTTQIKMKAIMVMKVKITMVVKAITMMDREILVRLPLKFRYKLNMSNLFK